MKKTRSLTLALALTLTLTGSAISAQWSLRLGFETSRTDSQFIGSDAMAKYAAEKSGGRIEITLFPDSVLGSGPAMLSQMRTGALDIYLGGSGYFANMAQALNIVDIPFLFMGYKHVDAVLEGALGRKMLDTLDAYGMKGLSFFENGFRCITSSRGPMRTAGDVRGLRLRTLANPMHIEAWMLLGTNPVPMPLSELYAALEKKAVEGQEHPLNVTYSAKLYEVQRFISSSNHAYSPLILAMNKAKFDALPKSIQNILIEAANHGARAQKDFIRANIARMVEEMAAAGCEVVPAGEIDMQSFIDVVGQKTRDMYLKDYGGDAGPAWLAEIDAAEVQD